MKKLITILVILTVLVGAIFAAAESHQIKITVTIAEVVPAFQLKYKTANSNSNGTAFADAAQRVDSTSVVADLNFESDTASDRLVVVDACIANAAKQSKVYTLTFSDGAFKTSGNNPTTVATPGITAKVGSGPGYGTGVSTSVNGGAVATVTFNGTDRCVANTLVAQAEYQYPKANIAPGTYTADIIMTVATN